MERPANELSKLVLRSLTNMRIAKTQVIPLAIDLPSAAAVAMQIKIRDDLLRNIRSIRVNLGRRIAHRSSAARRASSARKSRNRVRASRRSRHHLVY